MKKRVLSMLLAALFIALAVMPMCVFASAEEDAGNETKSLPKGLVIGCVGDSITYGSGSGNNPSKPGAKNDLASYPGQLAALIGGETKVIGGGDGVTCVTFENSNCTVYNDGKASTAVLNDAVAGAIFEKGALHVEEIMTSYNRTDLDIVILMLGTNDSKITAVRKSGKREVGIWSMISAHHDNTIMDVVIDEDGKVDPTGVADKDGETVALLPTPAQEFEVRYRTLINKYLEMDSKPYVYCMLPIPALSNDLEKNYRISDENMREEICPLITDIVESLQAEGKPVGLINMREAFPDPTTEEGAAELQTLLVDEVHPNSDGYKIMAETIYNRLLADTRTLSFCVEDADESASAAIPKDVVAIGPQTVTIKNTHGLLTKKGKAILGWSTEPNGGGTVYNEGDQIALSAETGDITLYPIWPKANIGMIIGIAAGAVLVVGLFAAGFVVLKKSKK